MPQPDPTALMAALSDLDMGSRPHAPKIPGATDTQRRQGRRLAAIHALHLEDMAQVRALMDRIETDRHAAGRLADAVADLRMSPNLRAFGALCGRECTHLTFHHNSEETHVFPVLEALGGSGIVAVVAKLRSEHLVVHRLLDDLGRSARDVAATPGMESYTALRKTFASLDAVLRSHFDYEETELEEALGVFGAI